ncbi:hypothetical protein V8C43DRAFT_197081 [Trichoderma afarasin]
MGLRGIVACFTRRTRRDIRKLGGENPAYTGVSAVTSARRDGEATYMYPLPLSNGSRPHSHHSLLHTTKYNYEDTAEMHGSMRLLFDLQYLDVASRLGWPPINLIQPGGLPCANLESHRLPSPAQPAVVASQRLGASTVLVLFSMAGRLQYGRRPEAGSLAWNEWVVDVTAPLCSNLFLLLLLLLLQGPFLFISCVRVCVSVGAGYQQI